MAFSEDLSAFFSDFAVSATFNGETVQVLFDCPDQIIGEGQVQTTEYLMTYPVGKFTTLAYGETLTVDGDTYEAHQPMKMDDGQLMTVRLTKQ